MNIGIIGAGLIGKTLAKKLGSSGHTVSLADAKGVAEIAATAKDAGAEAVDLEAVFTGIEVLILAIPLLRTPELTKTLKGKLHDNVVVIETTNYWPHRDGRIEEIENGTVNSVWVQQQLDRNVVKAFSNIGAYSLLTEGKPKDKDGRIAIAVSGDVQKDIDLVMGLVDDVGFDALDSGPLADSWKQQACGPAYCTDLPLDELKKARESSVRETLVDKQHLSFEIMKDLGQEFFDVLVSGEYPHNWVDQAVDINRSINGLPPRNIEK